MKRLLLVYKGDGGGLEEDLKLSGKLFEPHWYLFLHLPHIRTTKSIPHSLTGWCMYTTNRVYSVAPELRCIPPYKTRHLFDFSSTHLAHLHPFSPIPLTIFISYSQKPEPRENVSQRWFSVFAYFSQRRLTFYRSSTDVSTPPAATS